MVDLASLDLAREFAAEARTQHPWKEWVYFIGAGNFDKRSPVKIGWTNQPPERRLAAIQQAHWQTLRLVTAVPGTMRLERALHLAFRAYRIRGEWFWASPELRDVVDELAVASLGEFSKVTRAA